MSCGPSISQAPARMCVACRRLIPRDGLFRLVRPTDSGTIVLNLKGEISGKGFYICRCTECLKKLEKDKRLRRNFTAKLAPQAQEWLREQLRHYEEAESSLCGSTL